jgi:hypothetical protein
MSFGNQPALGISPSIIYTFNNDFSLGTAITYMYNEIGNLTTNVYAISLISLYRIQR